MKPLSLEGKFLFICLLAVLLAVAATGLAIRLLDSPVLGTLLGACFAIPATLFLGRRFTGPINRAIEALVDGVASFRDSDFSVSLGSNRRDELGELIRAYNQVGEVLRAERQNLFQRELLLDTLIQATPTALILTDVNGNVVYSNSAARRLMLKGRRLEGFRFETLLREHAPDFLDAVLLRRDRLFSVQRQEEEEIYHYASGHFTLNTRPHELHLFKRLTHEINRQEVATWKKVIRVISHELNNSLAPISSLAHSGREHLRRENFERLDEIFNTIGERAGFLKTFIEGYARFAKLPAPRKEPTDWAQFMRSLGDMQPYTLVGKLPREPGSFDPSQLQQVMLNLLKNAAEAGSDTAALEVEVRAEPLRFRVDVRDRGHGMSEPVLQHALLPFYSTKKSGSGLGLPLCREIIEAHGGRMHLSNRPGGGLEVSFWLPRAGDFHKQPFRGYSQV